LSKNILLTEDKITVLKTDECGNEHIISYHASIQRISRELEALVIWFRFYSNNCMIVSIGMVLLTYFYLVTERALKITN
jgi:hypothetical protein